MQYKLLNFHKLLANFASNIALGFSYSIIAKVSGSSLYALLAFFSALTLRVFWTFLLKPLARKYAQIFPLVRIFPMLFMYVALMIIYDNLIAGIILYVIMASLNIVVKHSGNEMTFIYSCGVKQTKNVGIGKVFEQIGLALAVLFGGVMLDSLNPILVFGISLLLYLISCIPLIWYYVLNSKNKVFNREVVSTAVCDAENDKIKNKKLNKLIKSFKFQNFLIFFIFGIYDIAGTFFSIYLIEQNQNFTTIGLFNSALNIIQLSTTYGITYLFNKVDLTWVVVISSTLLAAGIFIMPFVQYTWVFYVNAILRGIGYPATDIFVYQTMLAKARILGVQSDSIYIKLESLWAGGATMVLMSCIIGLFASFFVCGAAAITTGVYGVISEKRQRKQLVDFLCANNEKEEKEEKVKT